MITEDLPNQNRSFLHIVKTAFDSFCLSIRKKIGYISLHRGFAPTPGPKKVSKMVSQYLVLKKVSEYLLKTNLVQIIGLVTHCPRHHHHGDNAEDNNNNNDDNGNDVGNHEDDDDGLPGLRNGSPQTRAALGVPAIPSKY